MIEKIDSFLNRAKSWQEEMTLLRKIILECGDLKEEYKWMHPCYTYNNKNVVLIHGFKEYCALLFHKGVLLEDKDSILIQQTKNVQAARQIRFKNVEEILKLESTIKAYILEAIRIEKAGLQVQLKKTAEYDIPEEFQSELDENSNLKLAFEALTPGRQRAYLLYFSQPKQSKTRIARIEKSIPNILDGKGLNDK